MRLLDGRSAVASVGSDLARKPRLFARLLAMTKRFLSPPGMRPGPVLVIIGQYGLATPPRLSVGKMFGMIRGEGGGRTPAAIAAVGVFALAALAASGSASFAQDSLMKQGAKLLGFATDVAPPADFVQKSRPPGDVDFIPVFQPPPEPARPALKDTDLKALKGDLDAVQKQADALRQALPAGRQGDR